jgi:hypothetical protein
MHLEAIALPASVPHLPEVLFNSPLSALALILLVPLAILL